jgi:hypothetical protein
MRRPTLSIAVVITAATIAAAEPFADRVITYTGEAGREDTGHAQGDGHGEACVVPRGGAAPARRAPLRRRRDRSLRRDRLRRRELRRTVGQGKGHLQMMHGRR